MDSDLSLIEIAGEDDSLLQQIPAPDLSTATTMTNDYFSRSPLQMHISNISAEPIGVSKSIVGLVKPHCLAPEAGSNKENLVTHKIELPKLNVDPKQMKRRKKGGYNLRKSLAWDRAFFTEEGVLNPEELSMLTGTSINSCGDGLSVIHEEEENSSYNASRCTNNSRDLLAIEENLVKKISAPSNEVSNKAGQMIPKHVPPTFDNGASISMVSGKFVSPFGKKLASRAGICSRPLDSFALEKRANAKKSKVATKDSKLQQTATPRSAASFALSTKNPILNARHLKHHQLSEPAVDVKKNVELKSSFKKAKCSTNKAKPTYEHLSVLDKTSAQHSQINLASSSLEIQSLIIPPAPLARKNEVISEPEQPSIIMCSSDALVSAQHNIHITGKTMRHHHIQTAKPSGLRMPSPSLGFFSQAKASAAHPLYQRNVQPRPIPQSSIPGLRDSGESKTLHRPGRLPKMVKHATTGVNTLTTKYSAPSFLTPLSYKTKKSSLNVNNVKKKVDLPHNSKNYNSLSSRHDADINIDKESDRYAKESKFETTVCPEISKSQVNNSELLLQSEETPEKMMKKKTVCFFPVSKGFGKQNLEYYQPISKHSSPRQFSSASESNLAIQQPYEEKKLYVSMVTNHVVTSESHSGYAIGHEQISATGNNNNVRCIQDSDQPCILQTKFTKSCGNQFVNSQISPDCCEFKSEYSDALSFQEYIVKQNGGATRVVHVDNKSLGDVQHPTLSKISLNMTVLGQQNSQHDGEMGSDNSTFLAESIDDENPEETEMTNSATLVVPDGIGVCASDSKDSKVSIVLVPGGLQPDDMFINEMSESSPIEEPCFSTIQISSLAENDEHAFPEVLGHDTNLTNHVAALEYDTACKNVGSLIQGVGDQTVHSVEQLQFQSCFLAGKHDSQYNNEMSSDDSIFLMKNTQTEKSPEKEVMKSAIYVVPDINGDCTSQLNESKLAEHSEFHTCLAVQQELSHYNDEMTSDDSTFVVKSTCAENSQGNEVTKSAIFVIPDRSVCCSNESKHNIPVVANGLQPDGFVINEKAEGQPVEEPLLASLQTSSLVENFECFDKNHKHDPRISDQVTMLDFDAPSCKELDSFVQNCRIKKVSNGMDVQYEIMNDVLLNKAIETSDSSEGKSIIEMRSGNLAAELRANCENAVDACLMDQSCIAAEVPTPCEYPAKSAEETNKDSGSDNIVNETNVEDALDGTLLTSTMSDQYTNVLHCSKPYKEQPVLSDAYPVERHSCGEDIVVDIRKIDYLHMKDAPSCSVAIDIPFPGHVISSGFDEASESKDQIRGATSSCTEPRSWILEPGLLVREDHEGVKNDKLKMNVLRHPSELKVPWSSKSPRGLLHHQLDSPGSLTSYKGVISPNKESENNMNLDNHIVKPPSYAVPFSDEWLAAIEAAGEDILTIKSGAVQNSPPDKSLPESGPWSPVRRKNNEIGPFDCTKFNTTHHSY